MHTPKSKRSKSVTNKGHVTHPRLTRDINTAITEEQEGMSITTEAVPGDTRLKSFTITSHCKDTQNCTNHF